MFHCFIAFYFYFLYFIFLHFPLSGPVLTYISLLIIPCMIVYVTNNKEPWTLSCIRLCVVVLEALTPAAVHSLWISPTFLNGFCFTILSRVRLSPLLVHFFSTTYFPSLRLSINVLGHRALWTASLFCNDLLCLALLVQGVNGRLLDNCQFSSLPHDCVAYRTRLRDHLKAFAGVLS